MFQSQGCIIKELNRHEKHNQKRRHRNPRKADGGGHVLGSVTRAVLTEPRPVRDFYLLFENSIVEIRGSKRSGYTVGLQNRTRRFESCLPRHASFQGNLRSHKAVGLSSILRRGTILGGKRRARRGLISPVVGR